MLGGGWKLWSRESLDQEIVCYEVCFKFNCTGMYWVAFRLRAGEIREVFSRYEILHMSDSSVLKINTGSCGATFYDMNGDGKDDLVVGEFGEVLCPGQDPKEKKPFVQGRCRVYLNYGTKECPVYKDFKWLETNGQPLYVPITCCVPMVPAFADIDGDGVDELFSGCYPGDIYMWKRVLMANM